MSHIEDADFTCENVFFVSLRMLLKNIHLHDQFTKRKCYHITHRIHSSRL